jgi:hypothetical protein
MKLNRILNFSVVLYRCAAWSLALRQDHRVADLEKRVLWNILGPKTDEVTGDWRKFHSEKLHDLYFSQIIIRVIKLRRMKWEGHVRMWEERGIHYFGEET